MLSKQWVMLGCLSAFFGVAFGAFGAHALKDILSEKAMAVYQTGVHYQMLHAFALIGLGIWAAQNPGAETGVPGWAFTLGITLFSGSLYVLALTDLKPVGMITPLGGLSFLAGWLNFAYQAWKI